MPESNQITIHSDHRDIMLTKSTILYITMKKNYADVFTFSGKRYKTRMPLSDFEQILGDDFLKVSRGCLVSVMAIHDISHVIELTNGDTLSFPPRNRDELYNRWQEKRIRLFTRLCKGSIPPEEESYHDYYHCFDQMPIAFADIEMIFNEERHAVDWIFRYGNQALALLEKIPLDKLVGNTFSAIFPNMDDKWLRAYEQTTLYGTTLEIFDYSPEIDTHLHILCFPTFRGHCGCILSDATKSNYFQTSNNSPETLMRFFGGLLKTI